jgi:hypothetical protein
MSKKQEQPKSNQGQRGRKSEVSFEELTKNEKRVAIALSESPEPILTIKELVEACGWKSLRASGSNDEFLGKARGNSRVRNSLRRLVRGKWVRHAKTIGDGRYKLTDRAVKLLATDKPKRTKRASTKAAPKQATA